MIQYGLNLEDLENTLLSAKAEIKANAGLDHEGKPDEQIWIQYCAESKTPQRIDQAIKEIRQVMETFGPVVNLSRPGVGS